MSRTDKRDCKEAQSRGFDKGPSGRPEPAWEKCPVSEWHRELASPGAWDTAALKVQHAAEKMDYKWNEKWLWTRERCTLQPANTSWDSLKSNQEKQWPRHPGRDRLAWPKQWMEVHCNAEQDHTVPSRQESSGKVTLSSYRWCIKTSPNRLCVPLP